MCVHAGQISYVRGAFNTKGTQLGREVNSFLSFYYAAMLDSVNVIFDGMY